MSQRANRGPGSGQQTGFPCDVVVRRSDGRRFQYYQDVATECVVSAARESFKLPPHKSQIETLYGNPTRVAP